jgi:hypothetical protein
MCRFADGFLNRDVNCLFISKVQLDHTTVAEVCQKSGEGEPSILTEMCHSAFPIA